MTSIITPPRQWARLFATNQTGSSITAPTPTTTKPAGDGIIDLAGNSLPASILSFCFFGAGADNNTAVARITGWKQCIVGGKTTLWIPTPLASLSLTLSQMTGVADAAVDTDRFADTIGEVTTYTSSEEITAAATPENTLAIYSVDAKAHELVQVEVATGGSATNANALWSGF